MIDKSELVESIIFKNGTICYTQKYSFLTRKYINGFRIFIEFEDIEYLGIGNHMQKAEFRLDLFFLYKVRAVTELRGKVFGKKTIYKEIIGKKFLLPVNPEPEFNENSIYINDGHTPIEVTFIEILCIEHSKVKIRFDLQIFGKIEDTLPFNLNIEKEILLDIINPKDLFI